MASVSKYSDEVKLFITQSLACFDSPSVVVKAVKEEFGEDVSPSAVQAYDPTKRQGKDLGAKYRAIFEETRKTFLEDTSRIAISNRAVRLRTLQRMSEKAEKSGNMVLTASLLEQAAKEVGESYTNRREVTGKDGKDLPAGGVTIFQLPDSGRS